MYTKPDPVGITFHSPPLLTVCKGQDRWLVLVIPKLDQKSCKDCQLRLWHNPAAFQLALVPGFVQLMPLLLAQDIKTCMAEIGKCHNFSARVKDSTNRPTNKKKNELKSLESYCTYCLLVFIHAAFCSQERSWEKKNEIIAECACMSTCAWFCVLAVVWVMQWATNGYHVG